MPKPKDTLDRIKIDTPCTANWDEMVGNDEVRFCRHCNLSVHNLSAMTRQEALRLVISSKGKLCARYIRRPDGVIRTTDLVLPQLHSIKRRASRFVAGAFTAALSVSTNVVAASPTPSGTNARNQVHSSLFATRTNSSLLGTAGASVTGVVKDPNGAVIAGITVTLINEASGSEYPTTTDDEGVFRLQTTEEGIFKLKIEGGGFETKEITGITLSANDERTFDETLEVAGESVTVGGAALITPSEPLVAAVLEGDIVTVKELLANGVNVDVLDESFSSTPLSMAVTIGNRETVDILLNAGADVNMKNKNGLTALMSVTAPTTADIVWALIDAGAKIDLRDDDGRNALHYAADSANPDALQALLDGGASVDVRDDEDRTALMFAARVGNADNVAVLLKAGAGVNLRDQDGTTALGLAIENNYSETAKVLLDFGATE